MVKIIFDWGNGICHYFVSGFNLMQQFATGRTPVFPSRRKYVGLWKVRLPGAVPALSADRVYNR
jgi:hypothetical protein